jgi:hypothetical protein
MSSSAQFAQQLEPDSHEYLELAASLATAGCRESAPETPGSGRR